MPQFILDHGTADAGRTFRALDGFTQGYVEAMFFTNTGDADDEGLAEASFAELAPAELEAIKATCAAFQLAAEAPLAAAYAIGAYDPEQAGRDFWYTRCGHGTGFWDREALEANGLGDRLSALCSTWGEFGNVDIYRGDDGLIYGHA